MGQYSLFDFGVFTFGTAQRKAFPKQGGTNPYWKILLNNADKTSIKTSPTYFKASLGNLYGGYAFLVGNLLMIQSCTHNEASNLLYVLVALICF